MGVTVVSATAQGRVDVYDQTPWFDRVVLTGKPFARALAMQWRDLGQGDLVQPWPGLWVMAIPGVGLKDGAARLAVMWGEDIRTSQGLQDTAATVGVSMGELCRRLPTERVMNAAEAERIAAMVQWMQADAAEYQGRVMELRQMTRELSSSYEELSLMYRLSSSRHVLRVPGAFLEEAAEALCDTLGLNWLAVVLAEDDDGLGELSGQVVLSGPRPPHPSVAGDVANAMMTRHRFCEAAQVIEHTERVGHPLLPRLSSSALTAPLCVDGRLLGMILGGDKLNGEALYDLDARLCGSVAGSLSVFLLNAALFAQTRELSDATMKALSRAIDAKDPYTQGHSERVAKISQAIARQAGMDDWACERVYLSAMVHDVGKIGVPEHILRKPGRLTDEEFIHVKAHPEIGEQILSGVKPMRELLPGVLHHHERWDGCGYPHGLAGEAIPELGRLICVADAFDAMTSDRPYRRGMPVAKALAVVQDEAGRQFDPRFAEALSELPEAMLAVDGFESSVRRMAA